MLTPCLPRQVLGSEKLVPTKVLTDAAVARFKPSTKRREIPDARAAGLHLVIQPSGARSWALRFRRPDGKSAKLTLGPACFSGQELQGDPVLGQPLTLAAARLLAANIHRQRAMGIDVIGEHAAAMHRRHAESEQAVASTYGVLARQFIEEHTRPKVRRWREVARVLGLQYPVDGGEPVETQAGLMQRWGDKPVSEIDGHLIYQTVDEARRRGVPGIGRRNEGLSDPRGRATARALSKFFSWMVEHRKIRMNPCVGMYVPRPPPDRERVLTADELRWLWTACNVVGAPFGPMCKLLLLTGVRREEARAMTRAELSEDGTLWMLSGARTKNGRAFTVPLPPLAREIITSTPRIEGERGFVFTISGDAPLAGIAKCKDRVDAAMLAAAREERRNEGREVVIEPWRLHDLRRTCATGMADIGIAPHIIEAVLNHVSGHKAGVAGIYNRSTYVPEKRDALERWARHIAGLVSGSPSNVITMPRKGA
jgi:integrase